MIINNKKVNLNNDTEDDNIFFINLLDPDKWEDFKAKLEDSDYENTSLHEIIEETFERR